MNDFENIALTGGCVEINYREFRQISLSYEHNNLNACTLFQILVPYTSREYNQFLNKEEEMIYKEKKAPILMCSDMEGLFGRRCPKCKQYYRTNYVQDINYCPYCMHEDLFENFCTENQMKYIKAFFNSIIFVLKIENSLTINIDDLITKSTTKSSFLAYSEKRQQTRMTCAECGTIQDILGKYAYCTKCKTRNTLPDFISSLSEYDKELDKYILEGSSISQKCLKDILNESVSFFEVLGKDVEMQLKKSNFLAKKIKINFQNLEEANKVIKNHTGFEFIDLDKQEKDFVFRCFNQRHLFMHNSGVVDEKYIERTNDKSIVLGQILRLRENDIKKLIYLLIEMGKNLCSLCEKPRNKSIEI
jgi:hypothetical protein